MGAYIKEGHAMLHGALLAEEKRTRRVNLTLTETYGDGLERYAALDRTADTTWAARCVEREIDYRERGNRSEEVTPAEADLLSGLRFLRNDDPLAYDSVVGWLAMSRYSRDARAGLVRMASEFHAGIADRVRSTPGKPREAEPPQRQDDPKKRKG